nr:MAG TPA: hypothetical protein [Bacteriophage sp.]
MVNIVTLPFHQRILFYHNYTVANHTYLLFDAASIVYL